MRTVKRFFAAMTMVISAVVFFMLLAGIIGSWFVNAQLRVAGTNLLLSGETSLTAARAGLGGASELLQTSLDSLAEVQERAGDFGVLVTDNAVILERIDGRLNVDVQPALARATERLDAVEDNLAAINDAIVAIDAIPLVRVDVTALPGLSLVSETLGMLQQLRQDVRDFVARVSEQRDQIVAGARELVLEPTREISGRILAVSTRLGDADARLGSTIDSMRALRERLPRILNTITVILNIFFALSMVAFASLFSHALQYYRCPDDGLRGLLPPEHCASQMVPATVVRPAQTE